MFQARWKQLKNESYERHKSSPECMEAKRLSARVYRDRHKHDAKFQAKERRGSLKRTERYHSDPEYRERVRQYNRTWAANAGKYYRERQRAASQQRIRALWEALFEKVSNRCSKCGETDTVVLQLHHLNGNGASERKRMRKCQILRKAIQNPGDYMVLCANCHVRIHASMKCEAALKKFAQQGTP